MKYLFVFTLLIACQVGFAQNADQQFEVACVGFYNLENLFDTLDTENKRDEEFTPEGRNGWNSERYTHKLSQLGEVISELGTSVSPDGLALLGVCEVENEAALRDLTNEESLQKRGYEIAFVDGPDRRGIDVGLLYQPKYFSVTSMKSHTLSTADTTFRTRDQLLVTGTLLGEETHVIVAHWPSRSGGQKRSEPKRMAAAQLGKQIVDSLIAINPDAKILYMGDLNDDPTNKSCRGVMQGMATKDQTRGSKLYNPMVDLYHKGVGSLAWRDTWNLFDQIMMSKGLLDESRSTWSHHTTRVYNKPFLTQKAGNFKGYPFRTFSGGTWTGGFSDHFPVYVVLARQAGK